MLIIDGFMRVLALSSQSSPFLGHRFQVSVVPRSLSGGLVQASLVFCFRRYDLCLLYCHMAPFVKVYCCRSSSSCFCRVLLLPCDGDDEEDGHNCNNEGARGEEGREGGGEGGTGGRKGRRAGNFDLWDMRPDASSSAWFGYPGAWPEPLEVDRG